MWHYSWVILGTFLIFILQIPLGENTYSHDIINTDESCLPNRSIHHRSLAGVSSLCIQFPRNTTLLGRCCTFSNNIMKPECGLFWLFLSSFHNWNACSFSISTFASTKNSSHYHFLSELLQEFLNKSPYWSCHLSFSSFTHCHHIILILWPEHFQVRYISMAPLFPHDNV